MSEQKFKVYEEYTETKMDEEGLMTLTRFSAEEFTALQIYNMITAPDSDFWGDGDCDFSRQVKYITDCKNVVLFSIDSCRTAGDVKEAQRRIKEMMRSIVIYETEHDDDSESIRAAEDAAAERMLSRRR